MGFTIGESSAAAFRQELRGHPGVETRYRRTEKPVFTASAAIHAEAVADDAATDGCFPLVTDAVAMTPAEALAAYRYQSNLERRHHMLKGSQEVAPVYLQTPRRSEALLLRHFFATGSPLRLQSRALQSAACFSLVTGCSQDMTAVKRTNAVTPSP